MSAHSVKSPFLSPRFLLPVAVLGVGSVGYAALSRRVAEPISGHTVVSSASLPVLPGQTIAVSGSFVRGASPLAAQAMPSHAVTHPFEKNTPPPAPLYTEIIGPGGKPGLRMRPVEGGSVPPENAWVVAEAEMRRLQEYVEPPLSLVSRTKQATIYSRDINRPLCVARAGAKEWIGTEIGIKCVDREREVVRIFAASDGLPMGRVEQIATDDSGDAAVALVRRIDNRTGVTQKYTTDWKPDQVAVCLYDSKTGRWQALGELPLAELKPENLPIEKVSHLGYNYKVRYHLTMTAKQVIVLPSAARTDSKNAFAVYDRSTGQIQDALWEASFRADHPLIVVNAVTRQGDILVLGTDIGLLLYDTAEKSWRRALPTQDVQQVTVGQSGDAPIVALSVPRDSGNSYRSLGDSQILCVSSRTGEILTPVKKLPAGHMGDGVMTAAPDGTIWLTYADCFYKADSGAGGWTRLNDRGEASAEARKTPFHPGMGEDWDPFYRKPILPVAPESAIPDEAAIACLLMVRGGAPFGKPQESVSGRETMRWMRQRFGRWLSPAAPDAEEPVPLQVLSYRKDPVGAFLPDPNDPKMAFGLQGKTLLHLPKKWVPGDEPSPFETNGMRYRIYKPLSPDARNVEQYALYDAATAQVKERVVATPSSLLVDPKVEDSIFVVTANGPKRYDGTRDTWTDFSFPAAPGSFWTRDRLFLAGDGQTPMLATGRRPCITRLNESTGAFEPVPGDWAGQPDGVSRGSVWEGAYDRLDGGVGGGGGTKRVFRRRSISGTGSVEGGWQTFSSEPDLPALKNRGRNESFVVTGDVAWFRFAAGESGQANGEYTVAGYDARSKRWLAPVMTPRFAYSTDIYITETADGGALLGMPNASASVLLCRPGSDTWETLAQSVVPTAKSEDSFRPLLAPDGAVYAVTEQALCEYDPKARTWRQQTLPVALNNPAARTLTLSEARVVATRRSVYIGSYERGLWRMNRETGKWTPVREPLTFSSDGKAGSEYSLHSLAADKSAVWALGSGGGGHTPVLLRWDRRTKSARFLSEAETDLRFEPTRSLRLVGVGDAVLLGQNNPTEIFRAESGETRFTRIGSGSLEYSVVDPDNPNRLFATSGTALYEYDDRKRSVVIHEPKLPVFWSRGPNSGAMGRGLSGGIVVTRSAVYVGTYSGAYRYDRKTGAWSPVPATEGIWVNQVSREGNRLVIRGQGTTARILL